jgi:hypothetical protein
VSRPQLAAELGRIDQVVNNFRRPDRAAETSEQPKKDATWTSRA